MNRSDDEQFAEELARLRPRALSPRIVEEIAKRLNTEESSRHRMFGRHVWKFAAACAAALLVIASSIVLRWESNSPHGDSTDDDPAPLVATESPVPLHPTSYGVLRRAMTNSPESLMTQLEENRSSAVLPLGRVWRVTDHQLSLEEETYTEEIP